jgi:hypothetical protein
MACANHLLVAAEVEGAQTQDCPTEVASHLTLVVAVAPELSAPVRPPAAEGLQSGWFRPEYKKRANLLRMSDYRLDNVS